MQLKAREVTAGLGFPEGPIALADGGVLVVEIQAGRLTRVLPSGKKHTVASLGGGPNGAAMGPDGKCYVCNNGGFAWHRGFRDDSNYLRPLGRAHDYTTGRIEQVDIESGHVRVLYDQCDGVALKGPNDIVFDKSGGFWFTDHGKTYGRQMDRGAVYYARIDGSLIREVIFPCITPNGIGLSPDGRTLYVSETETGRLWGFQITGEGQVEKLPWPSPGGGTILHGLGGYQRFDSMALEAGGNICVATLVSGGISVFSPAGERIEFHAAPDIYCTNLCFGGPGMRTAFITLSGTGLLIAVEWPRPGLVLNDPVTARNQGAPAGA